MKKSIVLNDGVEYVYWDYEVRKVRNALEFIRKHSIPPSDAHELLEETIKEIKRFVWYAVGDVYPF